MNWDLVIEGFMAELAAMAAIASRFGDKVQLAGQVEHEVPSVQVHVIADTEGELWAPVTVQVDLFHRRMADILAAEDAIRTRYRAPLPIPIGNLTCWAQFTGGSMLETPSRDKYHGRAIRFTFTPLRAAYTGR